MKNLILILAIAFVAMFSTVNAEEILWRSTYKRIIDPNVNIDPGYIYNAIFTPDDKFIIVSCEFRTLVIEAETGKYVRDIKNVAGVIRFSQDGKYIYTYDNRKINFETEEVVGTFTNKGEKLGRFDKIDVSEKAGIMMGLIQNSDRFNWKKDIYVFDLENFELIETIGDSLHFYSNLTLAQNVNVFTVWSEIIKNPYNTGTKTYTLDLWDSKLRRKISDSKGITNSMASSADGKWIACVNLDDISIYDALTYELKHEIKQGGVGQLTGVAFSADSRFLATCAYGSDDNLNDIHIWDVEIGKLSYRYQNHSIWNQDYLKYSSNSKYLLGWNERGIVVYNAIFTTTKVDPIIGKDTLQLYPNPSSKKVSVIIENSIGLTYKILTQTGNDIDIESKSNLENNKLEIDVNNFSNGTYYLLLTQNGISKLYKFIKE